MSHRWAFLFDFVNKLLILNVLILSLVESVTPVWLTFQVLCGSPMNTHFACLLSGVSIE